MSKNILGVILARGNSKGIKNKNLLKLKNQTLIEIAINNAKKSKKLSRILFSSDSERLIKIARKKIHVNFKRPRFLATDKSSTFDVIRHAVNWLEKNEDWKTDIAVVLQPTTPFRKAKHIDRVIDLLLKNKCDAAMTICETDYPAYWMLRRKNKNSLNFLIKKGKNFIRRQDIPKIYQPAGMVYALKKDFLFKIKGILPQKRTLGYLVSRDEALNIDMMSQYELAKIKYKKH
tara:strand:+ start:967 stop:1662 length:696 start_codon:yes stop_codon:yes gene_type:complete